MSAYWKDVFREIWNTKGRYLSLLVIAALGAASVVGIQASAINMRDVADRLYKESNLYDIQIKSTMGFDEDDIEALQGAIGVGVVMPSYIFDAYGYFENTTRTVRTYSLPGELNQIELLEGRLPENDRECAVEQRVLNIGEHGIGSKLILGLDDMEEYHDAIAHSELTIVGVVKSPLFINLHDRGLTALGNGRLDLYVFLHPSAYLFEVYTDIYIQMQETTTMYNLSDEYNSASLGWRDSIKVIGNERVRVKEQELDDAREELADGYIEYYDGVKELEEKLEEGREELEEAAAELADAKEELEDGQRELDEKIEEALAEVDKNERELKKAQEELSDRITELDDGQRQLNKARRELEENLALLQMLGPQGVSPDLDAMYAQIEAGMRQIRSQQSKINEGRALIEEAQKEINDGLRKIKDARKEIEEERIEAQEEIDNGWVSYFEGLEEYEDGVLTLATEEADALEELREAWEELLDAEEKLADAPTPEWFYFTRKDGVAFESYYQDTFRLESIGYVFPMVFFLVAVMVSLTTMTRMVEEHRTQIGIYKALGYGGLRMMTKYLIYTGSAGVMGGVLGVIVGSNLFPVIITDAYGHLYDMPPVETPIPLALGALAVTAAVGSVLLVTVLTCLQTSSAVPAVLMRPKPPRSGKRVMLERLPLLWNRLGFMGKVTARNIFRYKTRFFMTLIGVAGCSALLLTAFGLRDSIGSVSLVQFGKIVEYDARAYFKEITTQQVRSELDALTDGERLYIREESAMASGSGEELEVSLVVPEDFNRLPDFINFLSPATGEDLALDAGGVIITEKLAEKTGAAAGSRILITLDDESYSFFVAGVAENYILNFMYVPPALYVETFGEDVVFNGALLFSDDPDALAQRLLANDNVRAIRVSQNEMESIADTTDALSIVTVVLIILACALALVVLFNLTNINIDERLRELATIKVLGFYDSETAWYIYRENIIVTSLGIALGLWGGLFLHGFILVTVEVDMLMFPRVVYASSYVWAVALSAIFAIFVNLIMNIRLTGIDMVAALKNVE